MTQHKILHKPSGFLLWHNRRYINKRFILCKNGKQASLTSIPFRVTISTLWHVSVSKSPHTQWVVMVAQAAVMATMTSYFVRNPSPSNFDPLFLVVPPFQHCHMTQHQTLDKPSGFSWWHKPSLWQQRRYILSEIRLQAILIPNSLLCHCFNTVTWLSIKFSAEPVGCRYRTSRRYENYDVIFCPKTMAKQFLPPICFVPQFVLCHMT